MRSREPWRLPAGQSRAAPFLQAAVLFAALCIFARSAALVLAAFLAAPVPAAQTLLHLGPVSYTHLTLPTNSRV